MFPKKQKPIYSAANQASLSVLQSYLSDHGIKSHIINTYLNGAVGELPVFECWPQLVLADEDQRQYAEQLIKEFNQPLPSSVTSWRCPKCHEQVDAEFSVCWNCGTACAD
jgi:hypothetical protein